MNKVMFFVTQLILGIYFTQPLYAAPCCVSPAASCAPAPYCVCTEQGLSCPGVVPTNPTATTPSSQQPTTPDPVNIFSGEDYFSSKDFSLDTRGPKLILFRKYRSLSQASSPVTQTVSGQPANTIFKGMFGYGWRTDYDVNLALDIYGNVIIYDAAGTASYFMNTTNTYAPNPPGSYSASPGNYSTLVLNADNTFTVKDKNGIVTHYDINGRLTFRTDRNGNSLTFVYNPSIVGGTFIQDASGRQIKLYFNSNGFISSAVDPAGKTYQYGYDSNGNLNSITDPIGAVTSYVYNSNHQIIQFTNANGHSTYYTYDSLGRATSTYQASNVNKVTLNYETGNTTVVTDSLGNNNTYVFNSSGLLTSHTDPLGAVTQQTWDANMNRLSITDARNNVTSFIYDSEGNLIQITDPLAHQTKMTYTPNFNLLSSQTGALGNVTNFVYDINGNLTSVIDALGHTHSFVHDQFGNLISATDSRGNTTNFTYDVFSHIIQKTDALGNSTNFTYE